MGGALDFRDPLRALAVAVDQGPNPRTEKAPRRSNETSFALPRHRPLPINQDAPKVCTLLHGQAA
eukprot:958716-Pyramimonas_sp.AAC.1